jgi:hypothetical protein
MNNLFECKVFRHTIRLKAIQRSSKDDIHASLFRPHEERHMLVEDHNRRLARMPRLVPGFPSRSLADLQLVHGPYSKIIRAIIRCLRKCRERERYAAAALTARRCATV